MSRNLSIHTTYSLSPPPTPLHIAPSSIPIPLFCDLASIRLLANLTPSPLPPFLGPIANPNPSSRPRSAPVIGAYDIKLPGTVIACCPICKDLIFSKATDAPGTIVQLFHHSNSWGAGLFPGRVSNSRPTFTPKGGERKG
jgi:hypothetical protein